MQRLVGVLALIGFSSLCLVAVLSSDWYLRAVAGGLALLFLLPLAVPALPKMWRQRPEAWAALVVGDSVTSNIARGVLRSAPLGTAVGALVVPLGLVFVILSLSSFHGVLLLIPLALVAFVPGYLFLTLAIIIFNRPRKLVPPWGRTEEGLVSRWMSRPE